METIIKARRLHYQDLSVRQIAKQLNINRRTVAKYIELKTLQPQQRYQRSKQHHPALGAFLDQLNQQLQQQLPLPAMEEGLSLPASRVIRTLNQILEYRLAPNTIRCDNGPEFTSHEFQAWATQKGIRIEYIQPGKPQQNAYIERYNRTVRYGLLNQNGIVA